MPSKSPASITAHKTGLSILRFLAVVAVAEIVDGHAVAGDFGPRRPREIRLPVAIV